MDLFSLDWARRAAPDSSAPREITAIRDTGSATGIACSLEVPEIALKINCSVDVTPAEYHALRPPHPA